MEDGVRVWSERWREQLTAGWYPLFLDWCHMTANDLKSRIILALDVPSEKQAIFLIEELHNNIGLFKIGLELINSSGPKFISGITKLGHRVFYDGKFMDIPNTVAAASRAVTRLGVEMFNIHALGGYEMMKAAVDSAKEEASRLGIRSPLILGVTILTSINNKILNHDLKIQGNVESQVVHLARLAVSAGVDGIIASPQELGSIMRNVGEGTITIVPGVRPIWSSVHDQKRTLSPGKAIKAGATYLVIGRPITKPPSEIGTPLQAVKRLCEDMEKEISSP